MTPCPTTIPRMPAQRMSCSTAMISAGPDTKADAMKRGPSSAVCHSGRPGVGREQEGRDGVDRDGPEHRQHHHREVAPSAPARCPFQWRSSARTAAAPGSAPGSPLSTTTSQASSDIGQLKRPMKGNMMPGTRSGLPQVGTVTKSIAHSTAATASPSPSSTTCLHVGAVEQVGRDDQQHGGRGDAHQEGEVGDVEAPGHLVAHAGDDQAVAQLQADVGHRADAGHQAPAPPTQAPVETAAAQHLARRRRPRSGQGSSLFMCWPCRRCSTRTWARCPVPPSAGTPVLLARIQRISLVGSSRLPNTRAPVGQASWQAGWRPWRVRCVQKWHFSTTPCGRGRLPR